MSLLKAFKVAEKAREERGWGWIYVAVDLHGTCIIPNYTNTTTPKELYPGCVDVLKRLSDDPSVKLIMFTCSHPEQITEYELLFEKYGINFNWFNENPDVLTYGSLEYGNYDKKLYFNLLLDDKAGFNPLTDWRKLKWYLKFPIIKHFIFF